MALFTTAEWSFTEKAIELVTTNPFRPGWSKKGRDLLNLPLPGWDEAIVWRPGAALWGPQSVYSDELHQQIVVIGECLRRRLNDGASAAEEELRHYELLATYELYCKFGEAMDRLIDAAVRREGPKPTAGRTLPDEAPPPDLKTLWDDFRHEHAALFIFKDRHFPLTHAREHLFACFFLFRRAFYHIFFNIVGASKPIAELRSKVWQSIVTHDLLGWMRGLHSRMKDISTLITGPSGTGKERVAEAIGRSQYIPFDPKKKAFKTDFVEAFKPVNLAALSPLLIESELFGHVEGAFTGAVGNRIGRLEECPEYGAVFLDEIGELSAEIQVKLLRVVQTRSFQRVGENKDRAFAGKIIAATNRDLAAEMRAGRFREDFYFRLCADKVETPSLREQLDDHPEDLPFLVDFICRCVVGEEKATDLAGEVTDWIQKHPRLGRGYAWPGNFRELEQCVRSYTIRKDYEPIRQVVTGDAVAVACEALAGAVLRGVLSHDEIERHLFTLVRGGTHTHKEAARLLGCDVRTLLARLNATAREPAGDSPRTPDSSKRRS
jgi:hypothetical protein